MKRVFFVIGAEGSGTYMLAEAFVSAGCTYCDKESIEDVITFLERKKPENAVIRRSLPHAGIWPPIQKIAKAIKDNSFYTLYPIGIIRDQISTRASVYKRNPKVRYVPGFNYGIALEEIAKMIQKTGLLLLSYEYFVSNSAYRKHIFERAGLPAPEMEFYDGNEKYY